MLKGWTFMQRFYICNFYLNIIRTVEFRFNFDIFAVDRSHCQCDHIFVEYLISTRGHFGHSPLWKNVNLNNDVSNYKGSWMLVQQNIVKWHHWPLVVMVGAPMRRFMGIWEAMASRLCWKACCIRRCCSSARRAIFLSGPSPPPLVSSFSLSCSNVAALAKPATCCWPRASAMEGLAAMMEGVRSSGRQRNGGLGLWIQMDTLIRNLQRVNVNGYTCASLLPDGSWHGPGSAMLIDYIFMSVWT